MDDILINKEFPDDEMEFDKMFSDEASCEEYLFKQKWPEGFVCTKCGTTHFWKSKRDCYICTCCEHQHSITAGTAFHQTHKSLKHWFKAIWFFTTTKSGISASNLERLLGISYPTAWTWLQKLKRCCVRKERNPLSGEVEVDEFYLGGKQSGKQGRGSENKQKIVVAVEKQYSKVQEKTIMGRIRVQVVPDCSAESLLPFIKENVEKDSTIITDKWASYFGVSKEGFKHKSYKMIESMCMLNNAHKVISLIKRWITGTLQTRIGTEHIQQYMDEYVFRFNRRNLNSIGMKFLCMVKQTTCSGHVTYNQITNMKPKRKLEQT
jgi:transposase-like protein